MMGLKSHVSWKKSFLNGEYKEGISFKLLVEFLIYLVVKGFGILGNVLTSWTEFMMSQ